MPCVTGVSPMTPKRLASQKYQQQKLAAVRAAASVFSEKGFHGASTRDIAERLGLKQGSLYYYFKSKQEALEEVCLYGLQSYVENMKAIAESDQPFAAKLFAVVTNHLTSYRDKSEALKVFNDERLYLQKGKRKRLKELGSSYRALLESIFDAGIAAGEVNEAIDPHFAAQSVIGICNGLGELIFRDPDVDVFDLIRNCTDLLLHGTGPADHT
jgi:AcrR family transcriptional regulator